MFMPVFMSLLFPSCHISRNLPTKGEDSCTHSFDFTTPNYGPLDSLFLPLLFTLQPLVYHLQVPFQQFSWFSLTVFLDAWVSFLEAELLLLIDPELSFPPISRSSRNYVLLWSRLCPKFFLYPQ